MRSFTVLKNVNMGRFTVLKNVKKGRLTVLKMYIWDVLQTNNEFKYMCLYRL